MKELVTQQERRWIAENASVDMGSKVKRRVIDLDKVVKRMRETRKNRNLSPYIQIIPISEDMRKNRHRTATFQKDPLTGVCYGIASDVDDFGNIKWQKVQLEDMLSLNLDNDNDAKIWAILRFDPNIEGSPFQMDNPYYKIYDPVDEALAEEVEIAAMEKAFDRVRQLLKNPKQMVQFARFIGIEVMDNTNYKIVSGALYRDARHRSANFNNKWEHRARTFAEHFYSALSLGIITESASEGYHYEGVSLGMTKSDVVRTLSKDSNILNSISTMLQERDSAVQNVIATKSDAEEEAKKEKGNDSEDF